jgi:hypothetical protein
MKKTLVYHLYVGDDMETNIVYNIHKECLKVYQHLFDNIRVVIAMDDLSNKKLKNLGIQWVNEIFEGQEMEITYTKNTEYRDAKTFYDKVLNNFEDEKVFFIHSKGTTNFKNPNMKNGSVFYWICAMYFLNLSEYVDTMDIFLNGTYTFSGPLYVRKGDGTHIDHKPFYAGTAYWINLYGLHNLEKTNTVPILKCSDRYFAERFPGRVFDEYVEYGITYTNNIIIEDANFYNFDKNEWEYISELYNCSEYFNKFIEYISNKVGYMPYSE